MPSMRGSVAGQTSYGSAPVATGAAFLQRQNEPFDGRLDAESMHILAGA